ncbi:MAG TPA: outer membrane protein transport protein [Rhodocyclaceae bacterium]|nr:outer membrane protein transport protein [Rhodocyclaceae bacterium]
MPKTTMRLLPALMLGAFAGSASAAAFQLWEQNASGIGVSYAGSAAVADNASTIFYNPAGMTQLSGTQVSLGMSAVRPVFKFRNQSTGGTDTTGGLLPQLTAPTGGNGGDAGSWSAVPNAYLSWQVAPEWTVGLGISSPFGLSTKYDDNNWIGRYQSLKAEITTVNVNPSVAYKVSDKVSLGVGLNYQKINAEMTNMLPTAGPGADRLSRLKGDDSAWGWNAGALFTLSPAMRVGVSYRSAIDYKLEGTQTIGAASVPASAKLKLPDTFILSVWQQVSDRWEAMGDLSYTHWSTVSRLNVMNRTTGAPLGIETFGYTNSWRFAWGAAYKVNEAWKTKFGIAYDRTPTTDSDRSARVPDNDRVWLSVGGQWKPSKETALDFGYAYLYLKDPSINQTRNFGGGNTSTLRGKYSDSGHVLGVQYSQGF